MSSKRVSVVCCVYNGAAFLAEQLESIVGQTCRPFEIIVQDDGSTDDTMTILNDYARRFPHVRVYANEGKRGINGNFFSAMHRARGEFIAISDQDDIWTPDKLELQMEAIEDKLLCGGMSKPFSGDGFPVEWDERVPNTHLLRLLYLGEINGHTMLINRKLLTYLPEEGFDCPYYYDWQLQTVAAAADSIVILEQVVVHFRRHYSAATATKPTGRSLLKHQGMKYVWFPIVHHKVLQGEVRKRFRYALDLLRSLPFETEALKNGIKMSILQSSPGSVCRWFKIMIFFIRHRSFLFHTIENRRSFVVFMRAVLYPFSCGWYYRWVLTNIR